MGTIKPSLAQGTRDFGPADMLRRNYIYQTLSGVFKSFGYAEIQTPSVEQLVTLTGKYGDEGDQLIFKILNSGDFLSKVDRSEPGSLTSKELLPKIAERALRYDLTVPFARFVVMNQNELSFPFKRFQIQPVWRADRPQKGRYREFFQCDADSIGSPSLNNEAELLSIYDRSLNLLGIPDAVIHVNNRKLLFGIAETAGQSARLSDLVTAIDKLDKIGIQGVNEELARRGFSAPEIERISPFWELGGSNTDKIIQLRTHLAGSTTGLLGLDELETVLQLHAAGHSYGTPVRLSLSLARGLNYYTGTIFEVSAAGAAGSIGGGGRYDDLTGIFGLNGMTGVGISFGADRIYDLMLELGLFPESVGGPSVMVANFYERAQTEVLSLASRLRASGTDTLLYPDLSKLAKQLKHAAKIGVPWVALIGESELESGQVLLRNMSTGAQTLHNTQELGTFNFKPERP